MPPEGVLTGDNIPPEGVLTGDNIHAEGVLTGAYILTYKRANSKT